MARRKELQDDMIAVRQMREAIVGPVFDDIRRRYEHVAPDPGFSKFLDLGTFLYMAYQHFVYAGLPGSPPLDILDLGTGAGYFPLLCRLRGHRVLATDLPEPEFYTEMVQLLGVERVVHRIERFTPLPDWGRFDLITGFLVVFNNHRVENLWGPAEWDFFIRDLRESHAKPGARLVLRLNRDPPGPEGSFYTPELLDYFLSQGAEIDGAMREVVKLVL